MYIYLFSLQLISISYKVIYIPATHHNLLHPQNSRPNSQTETREKTESRIPRYSNSFVFPNQTAARENVFSYSNFAVQRHPCSMFS